MRPYLIHIILVGAFHSLAFSQISSEKFDFISNNTSISDSIKEVKFLNIIESHFHNHDYEKFVNDTFMLMRWYSKRDQCNKVIPLNRRNIQLMDSINYDDQHFYRLNHFSLGYCLKKLQRFREAEKFFYKVLEFGLEDKLSVRSSIYIGNYFFRNENYHQAAEYFNNAAKISRKINYHTYLTDAINYRAACNRLINTKESFSKAIEILKKEIISRQVKYDEATIYKNSYFAALESLHRQLGNIYADKEEIDFEKAIYNLRKALNYANQLEHKSKTLRLSYIYHDFGNLYAKSNDAEAFKYFNKSLEYGPDTTVINQLYDNKANLYKRLEEYDKAKQNIQIALRALSPNISKNYKTVNSADDFLTSKDRFLTIRSLINKAEIYMDEAESKEKHKILYIQALKIIQETDKFIETIRLESSEFQTKLFWRNLSSRLYTSAAKACFALNNIDEAFYFMEKNKALLLLEDVMMEGRRNLADIPETILNTHQVLRSEMIKYENAEDSLFQKKLVAKAQFNRFIDTLDNSYKMYFKSAQPADIMSLNSFKNKITTKDEAYLEYIMGKEEAYGLLITKQKTKLFKIKKIDRLKSQVKALKPLLSAPIQSKEDKAKYKSLSFSIYSTLFPKTIQSLIKGKSLTIIPDNILLEIPFEALQASEKNNDFLLYHHQIDYANSLTFLHHNKRLKRQNQNDAVGFAPIDFNNKYTSLQNSKKELKQLQKFDEANLFMGKEAVKNQFKNNLKGYKIVHLSTHAGLDNYNEPFLVLKDSVLTLNELYLTKNSAELVVLSACETGQGELYNGEGVMSLSRGFFNTGAKSVASTLWSIDDQSTSEIMELFYKNLKDGQTKSLALHNAKLNYLDDHSLSEASPYYWASMVLVGDAGTIKGLSTDNYTVYIFITISIVLVFLFFFFKKKKKVG